MDLLGKARKLESTIARKLDGAARELMGSGSLEPIEIVNLIVEAVEHEVQPSGRGRRVFPFDRIAVSIVAPSREARARLEAIVDGEPSLRERIVDRLTAARCDVEGVVVETAYVARPQKAWAHPEFHVEFYREARPDGNAAVAQPADAAAVAPSAHPAVAPSAHPAIAPSAHPAVAQPFRAAVIELTVLLGTAEQTTYSLAADRIDLGRSVEIRDRQHRLIRMNHIAFIENGSHVNQSVSRRHAHITYEPQSGHYRLHDDGSVHGTSVIRNGRTVAVPGGSHGVRLRTGDEIVLGDARLRVTVP
jgi:FHA domain-containing protein